MHKTHSQGLLYCQFLSCGGNLGEPKTGKYADFIVRYLNGLGSRVPRA